MCGIVGIITDEVKIGLRKRQNFLEHGLIIDTLRGDDSTGAFFVVHDNQYGEESQAGWTKSPVPGYDFVRTKEWYEECAVLDEYKFIVGHNRASTIGKPTLANAHPFVEGAITLVHNGTLRGNGGLPRSMHELGVNVDSHAVAACLSQIGPSKKEVKALIEGLNGDFTFVWHDQRDDTLNIVRNTGRPLHMAQDQRDETIYFTSEAGMLHLLCKRNRIDIRKIYQPDVGLWLKFRGGAVLSPEVEKLNFTRTVVYGSGAGNYSGNPYGHGRGTWEARQDNVRRITRPTPLPMKAMMDKYNVPPESEFSFVAHDLSRLADNSQYCMVSGVLENSAGTPAVVYRSHYETCKRNYDRRWTVKAVAIRIVPKWQGSKLENVPVAICTVESYTHPRNKSLPVTTEKDTAPPTAKDGASSSASQISTTPTTNTSCDQNGSVITPANPVSAGVSAASKQATETTKFDPNARLLPGPGGREVSRPEWFKLTKEGCSECGRELKAGSSKGIRWIGNAPHCLGCSQKLGILWVPDHNKGGYC